MSITNQNQQLSAIELVKLAKRYHSPVFVYDGAKIEAQYLCLANAFKQLSTKIKYACKALNNPYILRLLKSLGSGIDAVSIQEVILALEVGYEPKQIIFTPNCVDFSEIVQAVDLGVHVNIDNISTLEKFGDKFQGSYPICIRINPHILAGGNHNIQTGHIDSKFGISIHQLRHVHRLMNTYHLRVEGLHMHTGSDILDAEIFVQGAEILFNVAKDFPRLRYLDFGSGFKVPYKAEDISTDIESLAARLTIAFKDFCKGYGRELELWFEPGKFLVSEAGYFLTSVNVVKQTTATIFAGVNSGLNHFIRPMLYNSFHYISNISNPNGVKRVYTVVGNICETDTFGWDRQLNEVREGDILCIHNAGAYGMTMASNYNSRLRPAEVLVYRGQSYLIRRHEKWEDLQICVEPGWEEIF